MSGENKTRVAIVGWGNVGRGAFWGVRKNEELYGDMTVKALFTRRPAEAGMGVLVINCGDTKKTKELEKCLQTEVDVAILCGGSKEDLPAQGPFFAYHTNVVDSFDTHGKAMTHADARKNPRLGYLEEMDCVARARGKTAICGLGWDPGTFSAEKALMEAFIPGAVANAFYGLWENGGLSMGHSDALRTIPGVKDARQYTHAIKEAIESMGSGRRIEKPEDPWPGGMHWRECFVVLEKDTAGERARVESEIRSMPYYFAGYRTEVRFVGAEEIANLDAERGRAHDGLVLAAGKTPSGTAMIEYRNTWKSNPEATGCILAAGARACHRLAKSGQHRAYTMLDIAPALFTPCASREEMLKRYF
jgi:diaminopimelate dehydrogenase